MNATTTRPDVDDSAEPEADAMTAPGQGDLEHADDACMVRCRGEHRISRRDIDPDALKVLYRLSRSGYTAYLVGGGVRDLLLARKPKDFDISTNAKPEEIRALFRNCILIGRRFRLAHIRYGDKIIETSTFRMKPETVADPTDPDADLFQRDDNIFGTPEEDALRRDFTVNGLFYDIDTFSVIDYVGGMEDLEKRRIRSIGDPCIRFREDPVRMIRAVRFASRLNFDFDPETLDAVRKHGDELAKAAPARLLEEITRLFAFSSGEKAVGLLHATGLMKVILPELTNCLDDPEIDTSLFWPRLRALDAGDTVLPDATPAVIFTTLLADPVAHHLAKERRPGGPQRMRFDKVRAFVEPIAVRLRFPRKLTDRIVHIFMAQHRFSSHGGKRNSIASFVTQDWFHEALAVAEINVSAQGGPQAALNTWRDMLAERIYGRDESPSGNGNGSSRDHGNNRRNGQNHGNRENHENGQHENAAATSEENGGSKMSRSARRRRNKKRNRMMREETERADRVSGIQAGDGNADHAATQSQSQSQGESRAAPAAEEQTVGESAPASVSAETADGEKSSKRSKPRRSRSRKRNANGSGSESARPDRETPPARTAEPEQFDQPPPPLTAAAFYTLPEKEKEPEKPKRGRKKAETAAPRQDAKKKADQGKDATEEKPKPLAMDKADEADIPMHWLDEI